MFELHEINKSSSSTVSNVFQVSSNVAGFTFHIVLIIIKSSSSSLLLIGCHFITLILINSYFVLFICLQCVCNINLLTFHIIKQHYSFIHILYCLPVVCVV